MKADLINETLIRKNSPIKDVTIISKFISYIGITQEMYIRRIFDKPLANELKSNVKVATQKDATGATYARNQTLILILVPAPSFYTVHQGVPSLWTAIVKEESPCATAKRPISLSKTLRYFFYKSTKYVTASNDNHL